MPLVAVLMTSETAEHTWLLRCGIKVSYHPGYAHTIVIVLTLEYSYIN